MLTYGGGAIVAIWLASVVVGAVNSVPLVGSSKTLKHASLFLFMSIFIHDRVASASEDLGARWTWIHWMVRVPLPSLQGTISKLLHNIKDG